MILPDISKTIHFYLIEQIKHFYMLKKNLLIHEGINTKLSDLKY